MSKADFVGNQATPSARSRRRFDRLYRQYSPWLVSQIRRRFGRDAEDVVQEAWLWILPRSEDAVIRHPKALLLRVASNIAIDRARKTRRRGELLQGGVWGESGSQGADQCEAVLLQEVVLSLPQPLRDVFVLSRIGGLTNDQIADRLGISPKTVEWRMTKVLAHCAAQLRR